MKHHRIKNIVAWKNNIRMGVKKFYKLHPELLIREIKCLNCGKLTKNEKYCSNYCNAKSNGSWKGKLSVLANKKNHTGMCHDKRIQSMGGRLGANVCKNKQLGAFFNPEINRTLRLNQSRNRKNNAFNGIMFDSMGELEFSLNIHYSIEKLVEGKNYQVIVGNKPHDFLIKKYKCFIEYHPWDRNGLTDKQYFKFRRKNLDDNGYKDYNLVVIK